MSTIEAGKNPRDIILKPVTTEKSLALMDLGKYTFEVDPRANKTEIKIALESYLRRQDRFHRHPEPQGQDLPHPQRDR